MPCTAGLAGGKKVHVAVVVVEEQLVELASAKVKTPLPAKLATKPVPTKFTTSGTELSSAPDSEHPETEKVPEAAAAQAEVVPPTPMVMDMDVITGEM